MKSIMPKCTLACCSTHALVQRSAKTVAAQAQAPTHILSAGRSSHHEPRSYRAVRCRGIVPFAEEFVGDVMTSGIVYSIAPDATVDEALQLLVDYRVSGLPVVDADDRVIGLVSDYDLLNIDGLLEEMGRENIMFPEPEKSWDCFNDIKRLLTKTGKQLVSEVMTEKPLTLKANMTMNAAARLLVNNRLRRMPVVDADGKLVGVLSRSNIVRAVLAQHQAVKAAMENGNAGRQ